MAREPKKDSTALKTAVKTTKPVVPYDYQKAIMAKRTIAPAK
jgi:hypothetical protein